MVNVRRLSASTQIDYLCAGRGRASERLKAAISTTILQFLSPPLVETAARLTFGAPADLEVGARVVQRTKQMRKTSIKLRARVQSV